MRLGTFKDVAAILGTSYGTVKKLRGKDQLPGVIEISSKIIRIDLDVFEADLAARARPIKVGV
jgi:hypothetical protein